MLINIDIWSCHAAHSLSARAGPLSCLLYAMYTSGSSVSRSLLQRIQLSEDFYNAMSLAPGVLFVCKLYMGARWLQVAWLMMSAIKSSSVAATRTADTCEFVHTGCVAYTAVPFEH